MRIKPIVPINVPAKNNAKKEPSLRKTRFDKTDPRKFPVSEQENILLKRMFKMRKDQLQAKSITEFITMLLRFGLRHPELINDSLAYKDTGIYKTIKPNQLEKTETEELAIRLNMSERKVFYSIVFSVVLYMQKGGSLNNEEIQPFKPIK
ncbi:hypothetical protein [Cytobacillus gottheilii]|uniref:Uncharacterized protein n=1 Tax=Cytobacillus gottheilii TaxID=859144 RepID=A0ABX8FJ05_9BACI|nr:hypothetical protein [Cytobacillus gottheilii]QVY63968.1 hypothetical protein J1899_22280 [Cytobacillus gottheilii]